MGITTFIGIDPGLTGAIAVIAGKEGKRQGLVGVYDLPVCARGLGTGLVRNQIAPALLKILLEPLVTMHAKAMIESPLSFQGQGMTTTCSLFLSAGIIEGVVSAMGFDYQVVQPSEWKRAMGLTADKNLSLTVARRLYPDAPLSLKKHHNRADAILLAQYCSERHA